MTLQTERRHTSLYDHENYPLIPSRQREIGQVLGLLKEDPIVFVWALGGYGKTSFGREFRDSSPINTRLILSTQLQDQDEGKSVRPPFDSNIDDDLRIIVVDEFGTLDQQGFDRIVRYITQGKRFVFLLHHPKNRYLKDRQYHQRHEPFMNKLIEEFPYAPWVYLPKWKRPQQKEAE